VDKTRIESMLKWGDRLILLVALIGLALIVRDCSNNLTVYDTREMNRLCEEAEGELYNNRCFDPQDEIELEIE